MTTVGSGSQMRVIDLLHVGQERVIGCWQVGDVLVDPGPSSCLDRLLAALAGDAPRALLLTHIHLDHAGATGSLVRRWPDLEVYVHERGARHLVDPTRLLDSARRLYGEDMDRLWGEFLPVPEANIQALRGGESIPGGFEVAYTPGHAWHHVSYLHEGTAFVGDVGGVRIMPEGADDPPHTPAGHRPRGLASARSSSSGAGGRSGWPSPTSARLRTSRISSGRWEIGWTNGPIACGGSRWRSSSRRSGTRSPAGRISDALPAYVQAAPPEQLYAGLTRYWHKRAERRRTSAGSRRRYPDPRWRRSPHCPGWAGLGAGLVRRGG